MLDKKMKNLNDFESYLVDECNKSIYSTVDTLLKVINNHIEVDLLKRMSSDLAISLIDAINRRDFYITHYKVNNNE